MDIPGLNEISDGNNVNDNFYFKEVIPVISPNIKFSILVFDCLKFDDEDSKNILIKLGGDKTNENNENFGQDVLKQSIFILNQIDKIDDYSKEGIENFVKYSIDKIINKEGLEYLKGNLDEKNVKGISSIKLLKKSFKFNSFNEYLECIIVDKKQYKNKNEIQNTFSDYLFQLFKNEIHSNIEQYESDDEEKEEENEEEEEKEKKKRMKKI